jgi:hypothetical protein
MANKIKWKKGTSEDLAKDLVALMKKPGVIVKDSAHKHLGKEFEYLLPGGLHMCKVAGPECNSYQPVRQLTAVYVRPIAKAKSKKKGI